MQVIKRSGEREEFDRRKTIAAIMRAGSSEEEAEVVLDKLQGFLYDGITTEEIYRRVRELLQGRRAIKFSLKKGLQRLGPEGEQFERYVARLFQAEGFETKNRLTLDGKCVSHEVDVLMTKGGKRTMVECKFHNSLGTRSNIQCVLYVHSRFLDLKDLEHLDHVMLATNTRFSSDAVRYAQCVGMGLLGWNDPLGEGIESLARRHRLYPITILETRRSDMSILLDNGFIAVDDALSRAQELRSLVPRDSAREIEAQARDVVSNGST